MRCCLKRAKKEPVFIYEFRFLELVIKFIVPELVDYILIIALDVRNRARAAILYAFFIYEITAAGFFQGIQRAVAKQAVKLARIHALMTGEVFAFFMTEK